VIPVNVLAPVSVRAEAPDFTSDRLPLMALLMVSVLGVYTSSSDVPEVIVPPVRVAAPAVSNPPDASVNSSEPDIVKVVVQVIFERIHKGSAGHKRRSRGHQDIVGGQSRPRVEQVGGVSRITTGAAQRAIPATVPFATT
jgi:hypothetical protein